MNERLHTACNLPLGRRRNFRVTDAIRTHRHTFKRLVDDLETLFHLKHTYQVAVIDVAIGADRNIKVELLVATIGKCFANIPDDAAAA